MLMLVSNLMVFHRRTKNLSPCSSAVIVNRRWTGTRRSPTPANVYLVMELFVTLAKLVTAAI